MMTLVTPTSLVIKPVPFLFPGKRQLLPFGMEPWEPDGCDDGDGDDLHDGPSDSRDDRPEGSEPAR